jgi:methanogenic corrinoid protein MtbC1
MGSMNQLAAELLESSAPGYAAAALALFQPTDGPATPGTDGSAWKTHLVQRVLELAAAVRVEQPGLFARRVAWLRRAAKARGTDERDLQRSLTSLRTALQRELPDELQPAIAPALDLAVGVFNEAVLPEPAALRPADPLDRLALSYLAACLEGEPERAEALVLAELERGLSPTAAYVRVLLPAQREVGQLWHVGDVSVAEERIVSETTRELMAIIAHKYTPHETAGRTLIAASVSGNAHDIGLRAAADLFRISGWRSLFLGANVPAADLARAADTFAADLILLSATLDTHLKSTADAISTLRRNAPRCKILIGGRALEAMPDLWQRLGADAYAAAADEAVAVGNSLVERAARK